MAIGANALGQVSSDYIVAIDDTAVLFISNGAGKCGAAAWISHTQRWAVKLCLKTYPGAMTYRFRCQSLNNKYLCV